MSRLKPLAALAVAAALALAVPTASASAARPAPAARTALALLPPGSLPCLILVSEIQFAHLTGNTLLESFFGNVFIFSGCGGAAI